MNCERKMGGWRREKGEREGRGGGREMERGGEGLGILEKKLRQNIQQ